MESEILKAHNLDLSRKRPELESIFDLVIKRIPDLCMPASYRWAGEDDFFNETCNLKLVPIHKQETVLRCLTPELGLDRDRILPTLSIIKEVSKRAVQPQQDGLQPQKARVNFESSKRDHDRVSSSTYNLKERSAKRVSRPQVSEKYQALQKVHRHYSKIRPKKRNSELEEDRYRMGFDRLFVRKPAEHYPFANPIPACMLAEENYDNLREIIVSSAQIEWKMLTPIRPNSDYEERYFDKLVQLHRKRYGCRYNQGIYSSEYRRSPFKHVRHSFLLQQHPDRDDNASRSPMALGVKLKHKFGVRHERLKSTDRLNVKLIIPTLTLTSDESGSELIEGFDISQGEELVDSSYESFSRYSKRNSLGSIGTGKDDPVSSSSYPIALLTGERQSITNQQQHQIFSSSVNGQSDKLDEQVESIINHLMNSSI